MSLEVSTGGLTWSFGYVVVPHATYQLVLYYAAISTVVLWLYLRLLEVRTVSLVFSLVSIC